MQDTTETRVAAAQRDVLFSFGDESSMRSVVCKLEGCRSRLDIIGLREPLSSTRICGQQLGSPRCASCREVRSDRAIVVNVEDVSKGIAARVVEINEAMGVAIGRVMEGKLLRGRKTGEGECIRRG